MFCGGGRIENEMVLVYSDDSNDTFCVAVLLCLDADTR